MNRFDIESHIICEGYSISDDYQRNIEVRSDNVKKRRYLANPTRITSYIALLFVIIWSISSIALFPLDIRYINFLFTFGLIPSDPEYYQYITALFIHGGFIHLTISFVGTIYFGGYVHRNLDSHLKYIAFFILVGTISIIIQSQVHLFMNYKTDVPIMGATGVVSAMFGYFSIKKPTEIIHILYILKIKSIYALFFFFIITVLFILIGGINFAGVPHITHIIGIIIGTSIALIDTNSVIQKFDPYSLKSRRND